ncbi:MAG: adenylate/guanylate cyclase domain-containing protein [Chloroflexota bacterium]|nr:adenylate/guanylate cyclase domain-containing protein [Chloroflexota bacterium]
MSPDTDPSAETPPRVMPTDPESFSYAILTGKVGMMRTGRRLLRALPSDPRCKMCAAPFRGPLAPLMRAIGKAPWAKNPKYCEMCFKFMVDHRDGAEVECSLLFADVRGSTSMAETMRPTEFNAAMDRFFAIATKVLIEHDAVVDKFVGDEVIAIFIPALTGELHAGRAIDAGLALLAALGGGGTASPLPVGAGVNSGIAYVGTVGSGDNVELTAMGDPVNVAARLASAADPGELLVTVAAAEAALLADATLEHRELSLKGKSQPTQVLVLRAGSDAES